ncbi:ABC transporter ATP-binding protein [Photobacterium sp. DNB22_13_2]
MKKSDAGSRVLVRLCRDIWQFKGWLLAVVLAAALTVSAGVAETYALKLIIDRASLGAVEEMLRGVFGLVVVLLLGALATYARFRLGGILSARFVFRFNQRLFNKLTGISVAALERYETGDIVARFSSDLRKVNLFVENNFPLLLLHPVMFIAGAVYLGMLNWQLLIVAIIPIPVGLVLIVVITRPMASLSEQAQTRLGKGFAVLGEMLAGFATMKVFHLQQSLYGLFKQQMDDGLASQLKLAQRYIWMGPLQVMLRLFPSVICLIIGGQMAVSGELSLGALIAFFYLLNFVIDPISQLPTQIASCKDALGACARIYQLLDEVDEQLDHLRLQESQSAPMLTVENVGLAYEQGRPVLSGVSLQVDHGEAVAIVGESGSGKSSLLKLLAGFYLPSSGTITLAAKNGASYRGQIALLGQDHYLFPYRLVDNVRFANPNASEEDIHDVARQAYASEFIEQLPDGLHTRLDEGGDLSVGQKQRIALMRTLLKPAELLLMDEPTASLDRQSEKLVQEAILAQTGQRTLLVVTHDLHFACRFDRVLVMEQGKVVEHGTPASLLNTKGPFARLWQGHDTASDATDKEATYA